MPRFILLAWALWCVAGPVAAQQPARDATAPATPANEFVVGPVELLQDVNGTPVRIVANNYFQVLGQSDGLHLASRMEIDLSDLQQKFPSILGAIPLPSDNCASYKPNNLVASLPARELRAENDHATMAIAGRVEVWSCFENPVPKTKLSWKMKCVLGICTKLPVIETSPGDPFKTRAASQSFNATLPVYFRRINDTSLGIVMGTPNVSLTGQYVFVTKGILSIANIDVNEEARKAMSKAIAPNDLIKTIPEEFLVMKPSISDASFYLNNGQLFARVSANALIPPEKITEWIKLMMKKPTP
ncbi:hypothetical protein [Sphingomonas sp. Leaf34]|uniref:hypothetical protein n=1 Tax=Sphingomonas sp. Leaf34 TaxID=1736216 RepID=UPI000A9A8665|nr:hypothetical protein [Sphingomonas sp. Leaf34]